jgi:uncharacterized small protein (DUF1192 family)
MPYTSVRFGEMLRVTESSHKILEMLRVTEISHKILEILRVTEISHKILEMLRVTEISHKILEMLRVTEISQRTSIENPVEWTQSLTLSLHESMLEEGLGKTSRLHPFHKIRTIEISKILCSIKIYRANRSHKDTSICKK